jgi:cell division protein FtsI/penicillin-binding protein 2
MLGCILNDGIWRPLALADAWTDSSGTVTTPINPPEGRRVIPSNVSRDVSRMLLGVVDKGTAKSARSEHFEIGGKTGTAKKVNEKNPAAGYDLNRRVVSFLGYISSASGPRLAGICIIDEPKLAEAENYGGHLAAPLFRRIAEKAMNYYKVPPQFIATSAPPSPKGPSAPRTKNMSGKRKSR